MEKVILIVFMLTTQSSYTHDDEHPATDKNFDTIQWWLTQDSAYIISTFGKTNDIHIHQFDMPIHPEQAIEITNKDYGDIVDKQHVLKITDVGDVDKVKQIVIEEMGKGELEPIKNLDIGFWNYDGREYSTQTKP